VQVEQMAKDASSKEEFAIGNIAKELKAGPDAVKKAVAGLEIKAGS
jgi:hypothetical protein